LHRLNTGWTQGAAIWRGALPAHRQQGETFRDGDFAPEMAVIPAGVFWMGSPDGEPGRSSDEGPLRRVAISEAFAAGRTPVTFDDWDAAVAEGWRPEHNPSDYGWGRGLHPVVDVNWLDAQAYARWLSEKTGHRYRLLTEAEWEYAARAGGSEAYATGAAITAADACFSDGAPAAGAVRGSAEVGAFAPNAFGLYDMHGNVWEWVEDAYSGAGGPPGLDRRVVRGGSWGDDCNWLRCACRGWLAADLRNDDVGFRVARLL
jgi:formylglycine-generating enzyme required for sulfatase activity